MTEFILTDDSDTTSGILREYYKNGKLHYEATIKNGKYVGVKKTFSEDGQIYQLDSLSEPCDTTIEACNGIVIRYNENGTVSQRYTVKDNAHNGPSWHYRTDGTLAKQYELIDDSVKNGYYIEFYPNGKVANKMTYKNDTIVGISYHFLENGDSVKYCNHRKGNEDFPFKVWFDKNHSLSGRYTDKDMKTITWIWYENTKEIRRKTEKISKDLQLQIQYPE